MTQPAPVLTLNASVHNVTKRHVAAVEARPAQYDENGNFLKPAVQPRDAYDTYDVLCLTEGGGFLTLVFSTEALKNAGGVEPEAGYRFDGLPVRTFRKWDGPEGRRYVTTGYSAASELVKPEQIKAPRSLSSASSAAS